MLETTEDKPWLANKKWASNKISSGAKIMQFVLWGFAFFWNLVSLPIAFQFTDILADMERNPAAAVAFLFPLVGLVLIVTASRMTLRWRRFGPTPLVLDPFPGSLGGHVGGTIDTNIAYSNSQKCTVTLSCLHSYESGSGKDRSRRESTKWQSDGLCHFESTAKGTRFIFRFDVPPDCPQSDIKKSSSYYLWRVVITTEVEGNDFSRRFEIPVFATSENSRTIHNGTEDYYGTIEKATLGVESIADIRSISGGVEAWFPAFQRPSAGIAFSIIGLVFAGIGIGVGYANRPENTSLGSFQISEMVLPLVFTILGTLLLLFGIYSLGKSLLVSVTASEIKARRFLFGVALSTKRILAAEFKGLEIIQGASSTSGNKTTVFYRVCARGLDGQKITVAERLAGRAEAELIKDCFETYL